MSRRVSRDRFRRARVIAADALGAACLFGLLFAFLIFTPG